AMFGFVTGEGVRRLLRFCTFLVSGDTLSKAATAGMMGDVFSNFSARATDGIAYGASFENGAVVDRYMLLCKPDLADALRAAVKPAGAQRPNSGARPGAEIMDVIPAEARDVTLSGVENPRKALDGIEEAISARGGVAARGHRDSGCDAAGGEGRSGGRRRKPDQGARRNGCRDLGAGRRGA